MLLLGRPQGVRMKPDNRNANLLKYNLPITSGSSFNNDTVF